MRGWLLDTNVVAELMRTRSEPAVEAWAREQPQERLFLSVLTLGEFAQGIANLPAGDPARSRHAATLDRLRARFVGRLLPIGESGALRWGEISGEIRRDTGVRVAVIDTLLAATAIEHELILATRNIKDVRLSGAVLFNPWTDDPADYPLA